VLGNQLFLGVGWVNPIFKRSEHNLFITKTISTTEPIGISGFYAPLNKNHG
jgi:hypothetical protein